jgi:hypothetical protein
MVGSVRHRNMDLRLDGVLLEIFHILCGHVFDVRGGSAAAGQDGGADWHGPRILAEYKINGVAHLVGLLLKLIGGGEHSRVVWRIWAHPRVWFAGPRALNRAS